MSIKIKFKTLENCHIYTLDIKYCYQNDEKDIYLLGDTSLPDYDQYYFVGDLEDKNPPTMKKCSLSELLSNSEKNILIIRGKKLTKGNKIKEIQFSILDQEKEKLLSNNPGSKLDVQLSNQTYEEEWTILSKDKIKQEIDLDIIYNLEERILK